SKKAKGKKKGANADEDDEDGGLDEEIFAENTLSTNNSGGDETDISAFVEVFRTRGFLLKQESVDKSNKMFVKMEFVKPRSMPPTKGKHAPATTQAGKFGKKKFIDYGNRESGLTA